MDKLEAKLRSSFSKVSLVIKRYQSIFIVLVIVILFIGPIMAAQGSFKLVVKWLFNSTGNAIAFLQYIGALVGGLATLAAVKFTIRQTKEIQNKQMKQDVIEKMPRLIPETLVTSNKKELGIVNIDSIQNGDGIIEKYEISFDIELKNNGERQAIVYAYDGDINTIDASSYGKNLTLLGLECFVSKDDIIKINISLSFETNYKFKLKEIEQSPFNINIRVFYRDYIDNEYYQSYNVLVSKMNVIAIYPDEFEVTKYYYI
ncbi:hypothetical protein [Clostridium beijerinckii]|uniref:hypothetical protein n=1 Tax=Clostridium beijerinckii TaxID=1520 RepID=UPI00243102E5|nr:hypothetical protein [Clostridium beijerinckii]MDG5852476.1 hypothetical protein [Clostridium beijerinckii]